MKRQANGVLTSWLGTTFGVGMRAISELFPTYGGTCSPVSLVGGNATAGNNNGFCSDGIANMKWTLTD